MWAALLEFNRFAFLL